MLNMTGICWSAMRNANYPRKKARSGMNGNANFAARSSTNAYLGLTFTASQAALWLAF
jgi:hypothetical protein